MIGRYRTKFKKFQNFIGADLWQLLIISMAIGTLWFLVESAFLFVMQALLYSLGLIPIDKASLYKYFPNTLLGSTLLLMGYGVLRSGVGGIREYSVGVTNQAFIRSQRERIINYALHNANRMTSYQVMGLFTETVLRGSNVIRQITQFTNLFTSSALLFILGIKIAPIELFLGIVLLLFFIIPINFFAKRIHSEESDLVKDWDHIVKTFHLGFKNYFFINLYQFVDKEVGKASKALRRYEKAYKDYYIILAIKNQSPTFAGIFVLSLVIYISKKYIGTEGSVLLSFFYIFIRISQTASEGNVALSELKSYWPSFKLLYDWDQQYSVSSPKKETKHFDSSLLPITQSIDLEMKNLEFSYPDGKKIFENFNLSFKTGDLLLIKGKSGTGKSTLLSLMLGIQKPSAGQVLVNGLALEPMRQSLAQATGYVGSEPFLIPGTVRENLLYGLEKTVSEEEIQSSLENACVHEDLIHLPLKLEQPLLESTQLSTGQKQRIAIARAYLRQPKLIIWDEATSNLDEAIEKKCIHNLMKRLSNTAIIVVSHKSNFDSFATHNLNL